MAETSGDEKPLWWKRHHELYDTSERLDPESVFYQKDTRRLSKPRSVRPVHLIPSRVYPKTSRASRSRVPHLDPVAESIYQQKRAEKERLYRMDQYKQILTRLKYNDEFAQKYTGKKFHDYELMHPRFWFPGNQVWFLRRRLGWCELGSRFEISPSQCQIFITLDSTMK